MKLEVDAMPVSDIDRAKRFYGDLGWSLDLDYAAGDGYRAIQFTLPGSGCSVIFGKNITEATPGSLQGVLLVVSDIEAAWDELIRRGIEIGELFHEAGGVFHHAGGEWIVSDPNPKRRSYAPHAPFNDPDGNSWVFQEVTARLSGDVKAGGDTRFTSQLVNAVRRMAAAQ